ncbi:hypothetical protein [Youngiibacter multivorans]|uniref:hypothetical protein n=1 Tax=Youngiibacter multivorans TaxID=937251 RepID=UPI001AE32456|nr:hypothetical protein [Youngiibacter multivorans]
MILHQFAKGHFEKQVDYRDLENRELNIINDSFDIKNTGVKRSIFNQGMTTMADKVMTSFQKGSMKNEYICRAEFVSNKGLLKVVGNMK